MYYFLQGKLLVSEADISNGYESAFSLDKKVRP